MCFIALLIGDPSPQSMAGCVCGDILSLHSRRQDIELPSFSVLSPHSFVASALFPKAEKTTVRELWPSAWEPSVICWNSYWRARGQRQKEVIQILSKGKMDLCSSVARRACLGDMNSR